MERFYTKELNYVNDEYLISHLSSVYSIKKSLVKTVYNDMFNKDGYKTEILLKCLREASYGTGDFYDEKL